MHTPTLVQELETSVKHMLAETERLVAMDAGMLMQNPSAGGWSILQILEHLNIYCRHYLPAIQQKLQGHRTIPRMHYSSGWLGNYFTRIMKPGPEGIISQKMKAPAHAVPVKRLQKDAVLQEFFAHQHQLLWLLKASLGADFGRIRIPTSLSRFITLSLGDTFRFVIAHQQRHFIQIANTLRALQYVTAA